MHPYNILRLDTVDSTNNWAKQAFIEGNLPVNTVILAETQTSGRGQMQTKWQDVKGANLLLTLVIAPKNLKIDSFFKLNEAVSLAVLKTLPLTLEAKIKWPNDILIGKKKLAGILIETVVSGGGIKLAYVGIGLNVNQDDFPTEINGTSLKLASGQAFDREELLFSLLSNLNRYLEAINHENLHLEYLKNMFGFGEVRSFIQNGESFNARIKDVLPTGELVLLHEGNVEKQYRFKEVEWQLANE